MKSLFHFLIVFLACSLPLSLTGHSASAERLEPAALCHPLDFDSYFVAQNAKKNLLSLNDLTHANFNQKYLLLRNEMMMETLYLIADCGTGKFFHEKLSGDAHFNPNDNKVIVTHPKGGEYESFLWNGERFLKIAEEKTRRESDPAQINSPSPTQTKDATSPPANPLERYDELFSQFPAKSQTDPCHALDFDSSFRAQKYRDRIKKEKLDKANFDGAYLFIKTESMFDVQNLVASCTTGKFFPEPLVGNAVYRKDSRLVRIEKSSHFPELYIWDDESWLRIPDPFQKEKVTLKNILSLRNSKLLYDRLENPKRLSIVRFEKLASTPSTQPLYDLLAVKEIKAGKCNTETGAPHCEIETE